MFDTIFIGTSGLLNHAKGLRVVGNNLANVNTPGFKSSQLQFANLFDQNAGSSAQSDSSGSLVQTGSGLASLGSTVNFAPVWNKAPVTRLMSRSMATDFLRCSEAKLCCTRARGISGLTIKAFW